MKFADLGLSDELLRAVTESGYDEPTAIQAGAIPWVRTLKGNTPVLKNALTTAQIIHAFAES